MSGRMVMVYLMCRELSTDVSPSTIQQLFTPCVAFRIVGSPSKFQSNVTEVAFIPEAHSKQESTSGDSLSVSEYVAIGISSVLLGLIYVASVFLYLHLKKKSSSKSSNHSRSDTIGAMEEGIVKNNPLLSITHHFGPSENAYSDSTSSDNDVTPDLIQHHDTQITSAIIHSQKKSRYDYSKSYSSSSESSYQDSSSFERLPEEDVSIVETLDERSESTRSLSGTVRKKLYFNPAYFEPHLLIAPPPAALEFLSKIREVIAIAKQKMSAKRFQPSLLNIPEEESQYSLDPSFDFTRPSSRMSRKGSLINLKRENSRRKSCTGCPGCEPDYMRGKLTELPILPACQNCSTNTESKQRSIRKWLEDVPVPRLDQNSNVIEPKMIRSPKRLRSPARSLPTESISSDRALSPRPASETALSNKKPVRQAKRKEKVIKKPKQPPPPAPPQMKRAQERYYDMVPVEKEKEPQLPPPDMIQEAIVMEKAEETRIPTLTKKQMNAVINELTVHKHMLQAANRVLAKKISTGYDTDSLERNNHKGYSTPSEYAEVSSSQPSPSLSTALPVDEEITMQNAILNKNTGNMTLSKLNMDFLNEDDHDYELVVMKRGTMLNGDLYKFPELLQNNNGYSLVSEVYVNNGYNYGSNPSTATNSNSSTLEKRALKIRYDGGSEKPGKLLIEVEDCLDHYIPINDSDEFEPDTLDRPNKHADKKTLCHEDSLERPNQILLKTNGSFICEINNVNMDDSEKSNFKREFGSLREMFEEKRKQAREHEQFHLDSGDTDSEGRLLTLEERHLKRQRIKTTSSGPTVQPDVIPPPPHDGSPIYQRPKPPRKVINAGTKENPSGKPPTLPKNFIDRSADFKNKMHIAQVDTPDTDVEYKLCVLQKSKTGNITDLIQTEDIILKKNHQDQFVLHSKINHSGYQVPLKLSKFPKDKYGSLEVFLNKKNQKKSWKGTMKPDDSGYLSTDSSEYKIKKSMERRSSLELNGSETDESLGDGHSESGAESVETHSVWFSRISDRNYSVSMDSGVINVDDGNNTSDSETVSYTTVVPVSSNSSSLILK
ncbi:LOW QUALITY PROTEIN: uncharacterized protein LOC115887307 [Sitophilus oryzae]|uniref:LOW QUALITY PROTEIN: uncharacterized protein LOC115887307 n=1 Tax=Sitophilus oryzae TaxID=7048 RepID=A0A6J2YHG9_SITOR|nr:LOW QUALITY PROTEIN: uncharacterized protein LOC115887307 [Sitophilus oryzae]